MRHVHDADAARALFAAIAALPYEMVALAYLDPERRLLGMRHALPGRSAAAEVPVRLIVGDALALDAASVVMAHNHPGGDPVPSAADRAVTRRLARALYSVDVALMDHIVLAHDRSSSFRAMGLL
jgi:DNA repair protein RadC